MVQKRLHYGSRSDAKPTSSTVKKFALSVPLAVGLIAGIVFPGDSAKPSKSKEAKVTWQAQKSGYGQGRRQIMIDFMAHGTVEQSSCDFAAMLEAEKPDAIFLESANSNKERVSSNELVLNVGMSSSTHPTIKLATGYRIEHPSARIYAAEAYTQEELSQMHGLLEEETGLGAEALRAYDLNNPVSAIDSCKKDARAAAEYLFRRNNGMAEKILATPFTRAVLSVGARHIALKRILADAGLEVRLAKDVYETQTLALLYEAQKRGWQPDDGVADSLAIRDVLLVELAQEYKRWYGPYEAQFRKIHFKTVASRAIQTKVSVHDFVEMHKRGPGCTTNLIACLRDFGINLPDTKEAFQNALTAAGISGCR